MLFVVPPMQQQQDRNIFLLQRINIITVKSSELLLKGVSKCLKISLIGPKCSLKKEHNKKSEHPMILKNQETNLFCS